MAKDFYSVQDIDPETDKEEIRKAYLQLARLYHPDVSKAPDARERFEEINHAYSILSDDELRFSYNLYFTGGQEISYRHQPLTWWKQYELALSIIIFAFGIVMWVALLVWIVAQL